MKGTGLAIITVKSAVSRTVLKITVKVSPVRQKISSVKAVKGKKLTVVWKKTLQQAVIESNIVRIRNLRKALKMCGFGRTRRKIQLFQS